MLDVSISGLDELQGKLANFPGAFIAKLNLSCDELAAALADKVRSDKLSGGVLNSRSGALAASIFADVVGDGESVTATVGSAGVPYAGIQEYGGKTAAHEIVPDKARAGLRGRRAIALCAPRQPSGLTDPRALLSALEPRRAGTRNQSAPH